MADRLQHATTVKNSANPRLLDRVPLELLDEFVEALPIAVLEYHHDFKPRQWERIKEPLEHRFGLYIGNLLLGREADFLAVRFVGPVRYEGVVRAVNRLLREYNRIQPGDLKAIEQILSLISERSIRRAWRRITCELSRLSSKNNCPQERLIPDPL